MLSPEIVSTLVLLLIICLLFIILNLVTSGLLHLLFSISFKKVFYYGLLSLIIPTLLLIYGVLIERNCYTVKHIELSFDNLPDSFDGYSIVQLSDIHSRSFLHRPKSLQRAVDKVNRQHVDLVLFTGDLITLSPEELTTTAPILQKISATDGVVSVLGNHDYGMYLDDESRSRLNDTPKQLVITQERAMGWHLLLNEHLIIHKGMQAIAIVGVENTSSSKHFPSFGNLKQAANGTEGMFRILLSHDPLHWEQEVIGKDFPLMLAGHTHAAQFSLFGLTPSRLLFKHYRGLYENGKQKLYVNIGLGETIVPLRIGAVPEITVITLKKQR